MDHTAVNEKYIKSLRSHKYNLSPWSCSLPGRRLWTALLEEVLEVIKIVDERCDHDQKHGASLEDSLLTGGARKVLKEQEKGFLNPTRLVIHNSCDFSTTVTGPDTIIVKVKKEDWNAFNMRDKQVAVITLRVNPEILTPIFLTQLEDLAEKLEEDLETKRREKLRKDILKGLKDSTFTNDQFKCRIKYL